MDRAALSAIMHRGVPFANPLAQAAIDDAIGALRLPDGARALDVGCGAGELLARLAARHSLRTEGIEPAAEWTAAARAHVDVVHEARFDEVLLEHGAYDLACCLASSHAIGAWDESLRALAGLALADGGLGWKVVASTVASDADWAAYEETLLANGEAWLAGDPDPDLRAWVDAARARWEGEDGRDTMGFALLTLRRTAH